MTQDRFPAPDKTAVTALGFDYGLRRIGVAYGQSVSGTARPLPLLPAKEGIPNWDSIQQLITTWQPDALVIGLPFNMDGSESELLQRARKFANRLHGRFHLPCYGMDERLSSHEAAELVGSRNAPIDSVAAQLILESWFAELRAQSKPE